MPVTASAFRRPDWTCGITVCAGANITLDLAAKVGDRLARALVRRVLQVESGVRLEELPREVRGGAHARRAEDELARIVPGVRDQLAHVADGTAAFTVIT